MASNINPYNIDHTYPVAGQDNDSQGFRDNFTNTRNNFIQTKSEIETLQASVTDLDSRLDPIFLSSSNDVSDGAAISLATSASYFTTASSETATLADGGDGQIKTLMMRGDGGDMVVTVADAGWKTSGSGTITFDSIGDACTLQFINGKWFCIGNNGCVFA
jgi:hypothetical protein